MRANRRALSGEKMKNTRGNTRINDQPHIQVSVSEAPNNIKEQSLQLQFIPYLQSERITVFEASLRRSNAVVQMTQQLPYLKFPIVEGSKSSYMYELADIGSRLNLVHLKYHQSVAEHHPNLVLKFAYLNVWWTWIYLI